MEQSVPMLIWMIVLCIDSSAALGFVKRKSSRGHEGLLCAGLGQWNLDNVS